MCKRRVVDETTARHEREGAYEGETVRLGAPRPTMSMQRSPWHHGRFHWWMLWLLWPLIGLVKGALISLSAAVGAIGNGLVTSAAPAILLSVLLIVAGLALLRRRDKPSELDR